MPQRMSVIPQFRNAACRAHGRHDCRDVWKTTQPKIARDAPDRTGAPLDIEAHVSGGPAADRHAGLLPWNCKPLPDKAENKIAALS